jgi:hypothetical protein
MFFIAFDDASCSHLPYPDDFLLLILTSLSKHLYDISLHTNSPFYPTIYEYYLNNLSKSFQDIDGIIVLNCLWISLLLADVICLNNNGIDYQIFYKSIKYY